MIPSPETIVSQNSSIIATDLNDEVMMMSIERGEYYAVEPVGAYIWHLIKEPTSIEEVCEKLMTEFKVDFETCQRDVYAFIKKLQSMEIVKLS